MNKSLKYSPNVTKVGFADFNQKTPAEQINRIHSIANEKRKYWFEPIFVNETQYFKTEPPVQISLGKISADSVITPKSAEDLTLPPAKKENTEVINAILLGLGVILIIKILS